MMINLNQKGYAIKIVLIIFALLIGIMMFPIKFPPKPETTDCFIGEAPESYDEIMPGESPIHGPAVGKEFVLIRKNVIAGFEFSIHAYPIAENIKPGYDLYLPDSDMQKDTAHNSFHPSNMGVVFLVNNNPAEARKVIWADLTKGGLLKNAATGEFILQDVRKVDVYMQKDRLNFGLPGGLDDPNGTSELFKCYQSETDTVTPWINVPKQDVSQTKDQLQLEWFLFDQQAVWGVHCKPAVYLYPEKKSLVNVKVYPKGELSYTDPPYDKQKGWTVWAEPNGELYQVSGTKYQVIKNGYLYYESKILDSEIKKPTRGWVVKYEELESLFDKNLPLLGLNEKEKADFENYWLNKLPESKYYFVGLIEKDQRDYLEKLDVTPNPETSIRFSFFFEMLDEPKQVEEPIIQTPKRNGFTLVDWGGMVKLHKDTPFTCSQ